MRISGFAAGIFALALVFSTTAGAEDTPPRQDDGSARPQLYLRGDIGMGWHDVGDFTQRELLMNTGTFISHKVEETVILGAGIGVQLNRHVRLDITGEYRTRAHIEARDNLTAQIIAPNGILQANTDYNGRLESIVGLFNGYIDLFTHDGITPYVGAGVGVAHNKVKGLKTSSLATFTDNLGNVTVVPSTGSASASTKTELAWALMAGASIDLTKDVKLDIGYRYLNLGSAVSAESGLLVCDCGTIGGPLKMHDLEAHEFRVGVRIALWPDHAR